MSDTTILCFGDSNTHGTIAMEHMDDIRRFPRAQRWPSVLAAALGDGFDVIADGLPARTSVFDDPVDGQHKSGLRVLPSALQAHRPVDVLVIMLGTNDLKTRFSLPAADIAQGLEKLAIAARVFGVASDGQPPRVLYVSPVPIEEVGFLAEIFQGGAAKSRELAGHLQVVAARQGAEFLDLASKTQVDPVDGVHLTQEGQSAVGNAVAANIQAMLGAR